MSSCQFYMAMKVTDLRRELTLRDLPTAGLKKDLAFRLASSDDANASRPLMLPHLTSALSFSSGNKEAMLGKMEDYNIPISEVKIRSPTRPSQSRLDPSLPSIHDHHQGDKDRRIRSLARVSTAFTNAFLHLLLIIFLSSILWHYLPNAEKEYLITKFDTGHVLVSSKINDCQGFIGSKFNNSYHSICKGIQPLSGLHEVDFSVEDLTWLHFPDHYKVLDVPKDASNSTIASAYNVKASRWQNENAANLSVSEGIPGKAVKTLRYSRDILLNNEDRERFDSGARLVKYSEEAEICAYFNRYDSGEGAQGDR